MRHDEHRASPPFANLLDKLGEIPGVGQIEKCIGFAAVAIAARDQYLTPIRRQPDGLAVFRVTAHAVDLEGMHILICGLEKSLQLKSESFGRDVVEVPQRMIEDHQHAGDAAELGE